VFDRKREKKIKPVKKLLAMNESAIFLVRDDFTDKEQVNESLPVDETFALCWYLDKGCFSNAVFTLN
jgi:hypothetical protein